MSGRAPAAWLRVVTRAERAVHSSTGRSHPKDPNDVPTHDPDRGLVRAAAPLPERGGPPAPLERSVVDDVIERALREDAVPGSAGGPGGPGHAPLAADPGPWLDLTSQVALGRDTRARGRLVAKDTGRLAGLDVFCRVFELLEPGVEIERLASDGDQLAPRMELCRIAGRGRTLLLGERTALNLIQRMSGTATLAARYVDTVAAAGSSARILDTRNTTPGLRALEKYAVRCGGAENHRFGLHDEVMVKNNHVDLAGRPLEAVVRELRAAVGAEVRVTAEARDEAEALAGIAGGADVVMLDNLSPARMRELCPRLRAAAEGRGRPLELEASGGITLENLAEVARSGVDRISIGALTHSAPALDLSFYLEPLSGGGDREEARG